jgi:hypothetical protein
VIADAPGHANPARIGQALKAGCDVDAVPENIPLLDHHIPYVDPDPEPHAAVFRQPGVGLVQRLLDCNGALDCIGDAGKLGQDAVAGSSRDASMSCGHQGIDDGTMGREGRQGCHLVLVHEATGAFDVGGKDRGQLALERRCFHQFAPCPARSVQAVQFGQAGDVPRGAGYRNPGLVRADGAPPFALRT